MSEVVEAEYRFAPDERPLFVGSPASPRHPALRRVGYVAVGTLIGVTATLGNAIVNVNVASLSGALGVYAAQLSWLPAIYVAMNASANLTLVKARTQFGVPQVTLALLAAYALAALLQLAIPGFATAVLIRAVCGMAAAALSTMTTYYLLQVFPPKMRPLGLVIGIGLIQLGTPLARLIPVEMVALDHWYGLHLIELAIALTLFAVIWLLPLPPSEHSKVFEPLDLATIALLVPAYLLICGVLGQGRLLWWTDTPWLGWALVTAVPLFAAAFLIERHRARPLLQLDWIGSVDILRFAAVALLVRLALAEQTYGSVGLLTSGGLTNDQLRLLFVIVTASMLLGIAVAALTLSIERLPYQVMVAALIIALGAWMDSDASSITRPPQLYLSQALIGFGTTLFAGPALVYGFSKMIVRGGTHLVSFIVLYSTTQNIGGLAGSAILGTIQVASAREHAFALSERLLGADPQVAARIASGGAAVSAAIVDPLLRSAQGGGLLVQAMTREANILAYNDVFRLVMLFALATAAYVAYLIVFNMLRRKRQAASESRP